MEHNINSFEDEINKKIKEGWIVLDADIQQDADEVTFMATIYRKEVRGRLIENKDNITKRRGTIPKICQRFGRRSRYFFTQ